MKCPNCQFEFHVHIRSNNQNAYMWGVVYKILAMELGYTEDEIHELMKQKFLPRVLNLGENEEYNIPVSTTELSTVAMEEYLSKIREWAGTKINCFIPMPNESINA